MKQQKKLRNEEYGSNYFSYKLKETGKQRNKMEKSLLADGKKETAKSIATIHS